MASWLQKLTVKTHKMCLNPFSAEIPFYSRKTVTFQHVQVSCKRHISYQDSANLRSSYDIIIIGAGHNGLVCTNSSGRASLAFARIFNILNAAYLQQAGFSVCVLERRHVIGGAAVTEEIIPGFKFSRASYLLSLFRPQIVRDLELKVTFNCNQPDAKSTCPEKTLFTKLVDFKGVYEWETQL